MPSINKPAARNRASRQGWLSDSWNKVSHSQEVRDRAIFIFRFQSGMPYESKFQSSCNELLNKKAAAPRSRGTTAAEAAAAAAFSILIKNDQDLLRLESLIEKLGEGWEKYLSAAVAEVRAREVKNVPFVSNVESPALRRLNDDQRQVRLEKSAAAVCRQESDFSVSGTQRPKLPRAPGGGIRQQHFKSER